MTTISVGYHSGSRHTENVAQAVGEGVDVGVGVGSDVFVGFGVEVAGMGVGDFGCSVTDGVSVRATAVTLATTSATSGTTTAAAGWQLDKNKAAKPKSKKLPGCKVAKLKTLCNLAALQPCHIATR